MVVEEVAKRGAALRGVGFRIYVFQRGKQPFPGHKPGIGGKVGRQNQFRLTAVAGAPSNCPYRLCFIKPLPILRFE